MKTQTATKDRIYNFRTNQERLDVAKAFLKAEGRDLPQVLNAVIDQIALTKTVPVKTPEELAAEAFLADLKETLNRSLQETLNGETFTDEEVYAKYGLSD